MTFSWLWTDVCFLFVLMLGLVFMIRGLRKELTRQAFVCIVEKPIGVCSAIVLSFFLMIGVLDSIHLNSPLSSTVLDSILAPLGDTYEKTYSAPMALHAYASETVFVHHHAEQMYPVLNYPQRHVQNNHQKWQLIFHDLGESLGLVIAAMGVLFGLLVVYRRLRSKDNLYSLSFRGWSAFITLFICLMMCVLSYQLSRNFHILGTGKIGQDIFYYTIKSIRTGLVIGLLTTLFMMPLALFLGIAAGYFGGWVDDIIQYIYTTLSSVPGVLLITASVLSLQTYISNHPQTFATLAETADARLLALCLILGVTSWTSLCRLLRAEVLKLREIDFVLAARVLGSSSFTIIFKHLLPNVMHIVLITLVLDFSFLVLAEAVLSYVGVGVSPMTISWGNMINAARLELAREPIVWWPMTAAFVVMFTLVLASNLFADTVREAFDPHRGD